ncbi:tetratricopeptide repeat protein [Puteibacter caeruleilacunae]|nr:tetratricopeptide repeat protein [Puteibacter caeruleilacunae]
MRQIILIVALLFCTTNLFSQDTFKSKADEANKLLENQDYSGALAKFEEAFKIGTDDKRQLAWTASIAGICAQESGNVDKAIELYAVALKNNLADEDIINRQITLCKKKKNIAEEANTLMAAMKIMPGADYKYRKKLLYVYYNSGQFDKAIPTADTLLMAKPGDHKLMYMKASSLSKNKQVPEAIKLFEQILAEDAGYTSAYTQLGLVYYNKATSIYDNGRDHYNNLKKPTRMDYTNYRNAIKKSYTDYNKAIIYLEKSYAAKPSDFVKKALFTSYTRIENKEKAAKYAK